MREYIIRVTDKIDLALYNIAKKDNKTPSQLVQEQMDYYTGVVIKDEVEKEVGLTQEELGELNAELAITKQNFLNRKAEIIK
jgi:hypothetical protein